MWTDVHAHTEFSDGSALSSMVAAAEAAGLDGLGLADHCIVIDDDFGRREQYDLVDTFDRRRERIKTAQTKTDVDLYDAAEVSYVPGAIGATREFLATADFDYTIGSVHFAGEYDYTSAAPYTAIAEPARRAALDRYYDAVVDMVDAELFDVLGHLDMPERREPLRGLSQPNDYDRVGAALADSRTVPEINAGRLDRELGRTHPPSSMLSQISDHGIRFVLGTDSHQPGELRRRVPALQDVAAQANVTLVDVDTLLE